MENQYSAPEKRDQNERWVTIGLQIAIGLSSVGLLVCGILTLYIDLIDPEAAYRFALVPFCLGAATSGFGAVALVGLRRRLSVSWVVLVLTLLLWGIGSFLLAFGASAIFLYDEPGEFAANLGFSVGFCMAPGFVLAALALILYWVDGYLREKREKTQSTSGPAGFPNHSWVEQLKEEER